MTEAGALFLAEARAVLARAESAELALSELGELKRYASQVIAGYWLPRYLVDFRRSYPGVAIRLSIGNTSQAAAAVRGGEARSLQTVAPTTTILARPFIEPDAVRAVVPRLLTQQDGHGHCASALGGRVGQGVHAL